MLRDIVKIDEDLCDGCGVCIPNCHEGALQMIDGKARLISDLMCDGLGACIGHCPQDAITIEKREAQPYDEIAVMTEMVAKGRNTVLAHLEHLKDHNETEFFNQGMNYLEENSDKLDFDAQEIIDTFKNTAAAKKEEAQTLGCGCPGSAAQSFVDKIVPPQIDDAPVKDAPSALTHWPVQMHLINPNAQYFQGTDILISADCVAFSMGNFHEKFLKGKTLSIACPKLDSNTEIYIEKIKRLIDDAKVNTITTMIMEVPCCSGLIGMIQSGVAQATRKVPVKALVVSTRGEIIQEEWI